MLRIEALEKRYKTGDLALQGVSFMVEPGQVVGLIEDVYLHSANESSLTAYAISDMKDVIEHLSNSQDLVYMGIHGADVTEETAALQNIPAGVYVASVEPDSPALASLAEALAGQGFRIARFEFGYMAARRSGQRKPPPKAERLLPEFRAAVEALAAPGPLIIGGKSMGGRVASMLADELYADGRIAGLLCFGYPFHPPGKPEQLRTRHLAALQTPTLICQGTRDPFGTQEEVTGYALSDRIELLWLEDGDHDLKPRKRLTGLSQAEHLATAARAARDWAGRLPSQ